MSTFIHIIDIKLKTNFNDFISSFEKSCWAMVKSFIEKNAYDGNQEFLTGFRIELNRFIENGSVHPNPTVQEDEDEEPRMRSISKISVKPTESTMTSQRQRNML